MLQLEQYIAQGDFSGEEGGRTLAALKKQLNKVGGLLGVCVGGGGGQAR